MMAGLLKRLAMARCFLFHWAIEYFWTDAKNKVGVTSVCNTCGRTIKM
jgi:hypothetical protein